MVDIDTHAGDGTVLSVLDEPRVFFGETYQPGFPGGFLSRPTRDGILRMKTESPVKFREYWERILARLQEFNPQLLLISAGFDAHEQDSDTHRCSREHLCMAGAALCSTGVPAGVRAGRGL